jgi:hypothetical protein
MNMKHVETTEKVIKFLCILGLLFLALSWFVPKVHAQSKSVNVKLAWDVKVSGDTRTSVRVYEKIGTLYTQVAEVPDPANVATVSNVSTGTHVYVVRAWNGQQESGDSNSVQAVILQAPAAPTTVTITVVVQ